jgi:hypothetical protein
MIIPPVYALMYLLVFHWVADFVTQTDKIALQKADNILALLVHVLLYTIVMMIGTLMILNTWVNGSSAVANWFSFVACNAALHLVTDFFTSKVSKQYWKANNRHAFFVTIGFDQLIHQVTLGLTMMKFFYGGF